MAKQNNLGITFDEFNLSIDKAVASVSDEIDEIVNDVWTEIEQKDQSEQ